MPVLNLRSNFVIFCIFTLITVYSCVASADVAIPPDEEACVGIEPNQPCSFISGERRSGTCIDGICTPSEDPEEHAGEEHEEHAGEEHAGEEHEHHEDHAGEDHEDHAGEDHEDHAGEDHEDHEGEDHEDHEGGAHSDGEQDSNGDSDSKDEGCTQGAGYASIWSLMILLGWLCLRERRHVA